MISAGRIRVAALQERQTPPRGLRRSEMGVRREAWPRNVPRFACAAVESLLAFGEVPPARG
jgi:hypothetical protein